MSKVITFSRVFPKYHPKAGQQTYFVEKVYKNLFIMKCVPPELATDFNFAVMNDDNYKAKHHTIRNGNRWKVGDKFSPRVWSDKPYRSKQVILADDITIQKTFNIKIEVQGNFHTAYIDGRNVNQEIMEIVAMNDGLSLSELYNWFNKPFEGQIICWNNDINY